MFLCYHPRIFPLSSPYIQSAIMVFLKMKKDRQNFDNLARDENDELLEKTSTTARMKGTCRHTESLVMEHFGTSCCERYSYGSYKVFSEFHVIHAASELMPYPL